MSDFTKSMAISASGMQAHASRLRISSENIANSSTPGYHRKILPFEQIFDRNVDANLVKTGRLSLDQTDLTTIYDPSHPMADAEGYYEGSNVNSIIEIADAREASRSYEANLKMFDQARQMSTSLLELLRR